MKLYKTPLITVIKIWIPVPLFSVQEIDKRMQGLVDDEVKPDFPLESAKKVMNWVLTILIKGTTHEAESTS